MVLTRRLSLAIILLSFVVSAQQGWYPPEGGLLKYRANLFFGQEPWTMPEGFALGRVSSIATDAQGNVYVFHRGKRGDPLIIFDKDGKYLRSWGKGMFVNPHNIRFDPEENLWITDNQGHQVFKCTKDGAVLMTLGIKGEMGVDEKHFGGPSDVAFAKNGDFYVSDGYQNSRIVHFNKDGKYLSSWGKPGSGPGEFNLVHALVIDSKGNLYASDHRNNRIQIFDSNGKFLKQWTHLGPGQGLYMTPKDELFAVMIRSHEENLASVGLAGKIMKIDIATGNIQGSMASPGHSIHVDSSYNIWIGSLTGNALKWSLGEGSAGRLRGGTAPAKQGGVRSKDGRIDAKLRGVMSGSNGSQDGSESADVIVCPTSRSPGAKQPVAN